MNPTPEDTWQAESDARTLIEVNEIKNDASRYAAAKKQLKKQAKAATDASLEGKVARKLKNLKDFS